MKKCLGFKQFLEARYLDYLSIGHGFADDYVWAWGKSVDMLVKKTGQKRLTHAKLFGDSMITHPWAGRFDVEKNIVSIINEYGKKRVPEKLKNDLKKEFGDSIVFKTFGDLRL